MVHDARDYDRAALSIAQGEGCPTRAPGGRPRSARPATRTSSAASTRSRGSRTRSRADRVLVARVLGSSSSTLVVALIGVVAAQLWGRLAGLAAMALAAVYVPLIPVGGAVMSEPLFAALLLAALAAVIQHRRSTHRWRGCCSAGVLAGLAMLTRANALILLLPLGSRSGPRPRLSPRALAPPAVLVVVALLTVSPWTIRNAVGFDRFVPVSTQLGSALAGTYNDQARPDNENPASWRSLSHIPDYRELVRAAQGHPEPEVEDELTGGRRRYIREHPTYVAKVALLDHAAHARRRRPRLVAPHRLDDQHPPGLGRRGVFCFWIFARSRSPARRPRRPAAPRCGSGSSRCCST